MITYSGKSENGVHGQLTVDTSITQDASLAEEFVKNELNIFEAEMRARGAEGEIHWTVVQN